MKVSLIVAAYNSPRLESLFDSARSKLHHTEFRLFLHSRNPTIMAASESLAIRHGVVSYPYGVNRGLSRSWNEGILAAYQAGADVVLVVNDDTSFSEGDLDRIAERAARHRDRYIVSVAGFHTFHNRRVPSFGYSCFAINPVALETIGCFDENFFPAYCEDQDYARRAGLAGLREENCPDTMVRHEGSWAIRSDPALRAQNLRTQSQNLNYYRRKWGGLGGSETFEHPFNDPELGLFIAPADRHAPYGSGHDRTDHEIVKH
jgi:GT2 family glycosyltransferase